MKYTRVLVFFVFISLTLPAVSLAQEFDTLATDISRILAGKTPDYYFRDISRQPYFQAHSKAISQSWQQVQRYDIRPVEKWRDRVGISHPADPQVLFYPFSGPDFLFGNLMFPHAGTYILGGLEPVGSLPALGEMSAAGRSQYLKALRYTFRYMKRVGYFVTKHMEADYESGYLNGTLHVLLYFMAQRNKKILDITHFYLDRSARIVPVPRQAEGKSVKGVKIRFWDQDAGKAKQLYYFDLDLSDKNMHINPQFLVFLDKQAPYLTYMKSASYILHSSRFSKVRAHILNHADKLLQDDTGIPYPMLKKQQRFHIRLFGTYTQTISDFDYRFQPSLKADLDAENRNKALGFQIGYSSWHNETLLIFAYTGQARLRMAKPVAGPVEKPLATRQKSIDEEGVTYRVQILISRYALSPHADTLRGLDAGFYKENGIFKYTVGNTSNYRQIKQLQQKMKQKGYAQAFVVAFRGSSRIPVADALSIQN